MWFICNKFDIHALRAGFALDLIPDLEEIESLLIIYLFRVFMKKIIALAAVLAAPASALATDLPSKTVSPQPPVVLPVFTWTGFYLGASLEQNMGNIEFKSTDLFEANGFGARGAGLGMLAGYDQMLSDRWLVGAQISADRSNMAAKADVFAYGSGVNMSAAENWSTSLSGRVGYLASPNTLIFTSLGATMAQGTGSISETEDSHVVGYQAKKKEFYGVAYTGMGIETKFSGNWRARLEYDTSFLKATAHRDGYAVDILPEIGAAKISLIYGFGEKNQAVATTVAPTWTGFYLGAAAGHNQVSTKYNLPILGDLPASDLTLNGFGAAGWSGSLLGGYNYQINSSVVAGAEIIGSLSTLESKYTVEHDTYGVEGHSPDWLSERARLGYLLAPETLVYGSVGYTQERSNLKSIGDISGAMEKYTLRGLELGGGAETWLTSHITARLDYSMSDFGKVDMIKEIPYAGTIKQTQSNGLMAILYHF